MVAPDYAADSSVPIFERGRNSLVCQPCVTTVKLLRKKIVCCGEKF